MKIVDGVPAPRVSAAQAAELLREMAALVRVTFGVQAAHPVVAAPPTPLAVHGSHAALAVSAAPMPAQMPTQMPAPVAAPAPSLAPVALAEAVGDGRVEPMAVPALAPMPTPISTPVPGRGHHSLAMLQEIAFLDD